jgi:hypothetical protein
MARYKAHHDMKQGSSRHETWLFAVFNDAHRGIEQSSFRM